MNIKELAALLDGRTAGDEISREEAKAAAESGLVVLFGASDDLAEFRGAIDDEAGCYDGGTIYLTPEGIFEDCEYADNYTNGCKHNAAARAKAKAIKAVWCSPDSAATWTYETDIPHETFDIVEDEELYCRGIVFAAASLEG